MVETPVLDHTTDDVLVYFNTQPDGLGVDTVPIVDAAGHIQVDIITSALPTGAATAANQAAANALLGTIDVDTGNISGYAADIEVALHNLENALDSFGLDYLLVGSVDVDTDDDVIAAGQSLPIAINLMYGFDGTNWERIRTDGAGAMKVTG